MANPDASYYYCALHAWQAVACGKLVATLRHPSTVTSLAFPDSGKLQLVCMRGIRILLETVSSELPASLYAELSTILGGWDASAHLLQVEFRVRMHL